MASATPELVPPTQGRHVVAEGLGEQVAPDIGLGLTVLLDHSILRPATVIVPLVAYSSPIAKPVTVCLA